MSADPNDISTDDQQEPDDSAEHPTQDDINEFFARLKATVDPLRTDCRALKATSDSDQRARRVYVRAVFAELEATLDMYAQFLLLTERDALQLEERLLLEEREVQLDDRGDVKSRQAKINLRSRIKFVFRMLVTYSGVDPIPNYQDNRWSELQESINVRDRLTHPKLAKSIEISDDELAALSRGWAWFDEIVLKGR